LIEVKGFTKYYGKVKAADNISFSIAKGEVVGFLGPNGAGKTTTMRAITGFLYPTEGTITIAGHDIREDSVAAKKYIGYLPENAPLYTEMNVIGYLDFVADVKGVDKNSKKTHINNIIKKVGLEKVSKRIISKLSKGFKQRVGIAQALINDPDILILDEPTIGLDPNQIIEIRNLIGDLGKQKTVILSSHILQEVGAICNRIIIISDGKLIAEDTKEGLMNQLESGKRIRVLVDSDFEKVKTIISKVKGVKTLTKGEKSENLNEIIITAEKDADIRKDISKALINGGINLYEQNQMTMSLEEVFTKLTKENS
jgi:ABC-2 type transport system ATP-binding protein